MPGRRRREPPTGPVEVRLADALTRIRASADPEVRAGMARFGIPSDDAVGVPVGVLRKLAKDLGPDHELAAALWATPLYEARMTACFFDDPGAVTPEQMDSWIEACDSWALCDTACFHLFDRTPHVFDKVRAWAVRPEEFVKRGAFALLASAALHGKRRPDAPFLECLPLVEAAAPDPRNFVKKGVSWALRGVGGRNAACRGAALEVAARLVASDVPAARWVGRDAIRDLERKG